MNARQEPVNVKWQMIWVFLPITNLFLANFWAACRVQKLHKFLILNLIFIGFIMSFEIDSEYYAYDDDDDVTDWGYGWFIPFTAYFEPVGMTVKIIWLIQDVSWLAIASYFTHRWSRQWNERFSTRTTPI